MAGRRRRKRATMAAVGLALAAAAALTLGPFSLTSASRVTRFRALQLSPEVSDNLALIYEKFDTEVILCLEGETRGDVLEIVDFRIPHMVRSTPTGAAADTCLSDERFVANWHNHPSEFGPAREFTGNCYLSRSDMLDFLRDRDVMATLVACGPRTFAYWWKDDVAPYVNDKVILVPPEGQLVRSD